MQRFPSCVLTYARLKLLPCPADTGAGQGCSHMLDLLQLATAEAPDEPQLGRDASPEVRRMLQVREQVGSTWK